MAWSLPAHETAIAARTLGLAGGQDIRQPAHETGGRSEAGQARSTSALKRALTGKATGRGQNDHELAPRDDERRQPRAAASTSPTKAITSEAAAGIALSSLPPRRPCEPSPRSGNLRQQIGSRRRAEGRSRT
jgi:hypothetical protein